MTLNPAWALLLLSPSIWALNPLQQLGKSIFFDASLSEPVGQSCASCHAPTRGFADPRDRAVSEGVVAGRFTLRSAPAIAYSGFSPDFHFDAEESLYVGGYFLDGRANTMQDQVEGPATSSVEMNNGSKAVVAAKLRQSYYVKDLQRLFGEAVIADDATLYKAFTDALVAYQRSAVVNPFSSKYDAYLAGTVNLTAQEARGLALFEDPEKANCSACHSSRSSHAQPPLFTDYTYDNLGVPKNTSSPFLHQAREFNPEGSARIDLGLYDVSGREQDKGKFKVTTLRNIAVTGPYKHNGLFKTLHEVVDFYNSRDVNPKWGKPEVAKNMNTEELGDLKLSDEEMDDLVVFMQTLTDGYQP